MTAITPGALSAARESMPAMRPRAMVLPSFVEGLPVALMEAFALGRPAIATYVAGIPELLKPVIVCSIEVFDE